MLEGAGRGLWSREGCEGAGGGMDVSREGC